MKPETPLPWGPSATMEWITDPDCIESDLDYSYLIHACNAYPKLVECVKEFRRIIDNELGYPEENEAKDLLKELGELE